jgi:hypothetical protein
VFNAQAPVKRSRRYRTAVALTLASASISAAAEAQQPAEPEATRFEFRAPEGCSSAEDFAARVRRRSSRIRLDPSAPATARALLVEVQQPASGALRGIVTVIEADGATRTRQLKAATCEEAANALSLIATVTLDPDAMLGEPEPEPPPPPPKAAPPPPSKPPPRPAPVAPPEPHRLRFSVGLGAVLLLRMAPEPAPGGYVSVALEATSRSMLAPLARLSVIHAQRRGLEAAGGEASFAFTLPSVDLCPLRFGPRLLGLRPCAFASAGLLRVWGTDTGRDESHSRFYGQAGGALLAALRVSEAFEIIADGRVGVPFVKETYGFNTRVPFFTTPTPGFSASLGAAGGFP